MLNIEAFIRAARGDYLWCLGRGSGDTVAMFRGACAGGHMKIVKMAMLRGADDYDVGLRWACNAGNGSLLKPSQDLCGNDYEDMMDLMLAKGATDYNGALTCACKAQQVLFIFRLIELGANECQNCSRTMDEHWAASVPAPSLLSSEAPIEDSLPPAYDA